MRISDIYTAKAVAAHATSDPSNSIPYIGEAFFPSQKKMGIDLKWIKTHDGLGVSLKPSAYDAIPTVRPRGGFEVTKEEMPFFRESMTIKEQDMVEIARAQESTDPYLGDVLANIYNDADKLIDGAKIAAEQMRMSLLAPVSGNMIISIGTADNTQYTYNYDPNGTWKADHYVALSGNRLWSDTANSKPLTDIDDGVSFLAGLGYSAGYVMMNTFTFDKLIENSQIANAFITMSGTTVTYIDRAGAKDMIARKTGLQVLINDKRYINYAGTDTKFMPDGYISILGARTLGNTYFGMTPEERSLLSDPKLDVAMVDPGIAVAVQTTYGAPVLTTTTVSEVVLPSFEGMDAVYVVKVL